VDSLCTDVKQNALDFYNDFSPTCDIKQEGELFSFDDCTNYTPSQWREVQRGF